MSLYSSFILDTELVLKNSGSVTASAAESTILDLGEGIVDGIIVVDVDSIESDTSDERYVLSLEMSNTADMTSGSQCAAKKDFGAATAPMDDPVTASGRYSIPFRNEQNGVIYRYVRLNNAVSGTVGGTGITYSSFIAKR